MAHKAPGKSDREGISLTKLMRMFPDDEAARRWIEAQIWPDGPYCPHCGSTNVQTPIKHKTMTHRCRDCPKRHAVQPEDRNGDAGHEARLSDMGHRHLPRDDEPERREQHEAAS